MIYKGLFIYCTSRMVEKTGLLPPRCIDGITSELSYFHLELKHFHSKNHLLAVNLSRVGHLKINFKNYVPSLKQTAKTPEK